MKTYYLARTPREKLLVLAVAAAFAAVWLTGAAGRLGRRVQDWRSVSAERAVQQMWLDRGPAIEARAAQAVKNLEPHRTLDATHLVGAVVSLAGEAGLSPGIEPPRTQRTGQFAYHTVQVTFRRAELGALVNFHEALDRRAPYLALEHCALAADRSNPVQLNAAFSIFSIEANAPVEGEAPGSRGGDDTGQITSR